MKTFKLFGTAILAITMCANFTSCKDDDEESEKSRLEGRWEYTAIDDSDLDYGAFTFNKDGNLIWERNDEKRNNNTYELDKDKLRIILNDNDDYLDGVISFSGDNKATYKYTWHDCDGQWDDNTECTMTLVKE